MAHNPHIKDGISVRGGVTTGAASADFSAEKNDQVKSAGRADSTQTVRTITSSWGVRLGALIFCRWSACLYAWIFAGIFEF